MPRIMPDSALKNQPAPPDTTSVYRYFDTTDVLVYVGITSRGIVRQQEHNHSKEWWPYVHRQEVSHWPTREAAECEEHRLIRKYRPPFNKQHNPGWEDVREAYLNLLHLSRRDVDPTELVSALGGWLPLSHGSNRTTTAGNHLYSFRAHLDHAPVASRLALPDQKRIARPVGQWRHAYITGIVQTPLCTTVNVKSTLALRAEAARVHFRLQGPLPGRRAAWPPVFKVTSLDVRVA